MLETPSTVTVLVNGAPVQTLQLAAGRNDVRILPGVGVSDVELLVRQAAVEKAIHIVDIGIGHGPQ